MNKSLSCSVIDVDYQTERLHGGTVGDVQLVKGTAKVADGSTISYKIVLKTQKKWERLGDPNSWRREYDCYTSDLGISFSDSPLRWAKCYHAELNTDETEIQLWLEYIDGVSGSDLTVEMLEIAAKEMGRYQGRLYTQKPIFLQNLSWLGEVDAMENYYKHWKQKNVEYSYIRSDNPSDCIIPKHLCDMLIDVDSKADRMFENIRKLPVVLCHRDFWIANIFYSDGNVILIDWDTVGWGYLGEDLAQLIADETDIECLDEYKRRLIPSYFEGISEYIDLKMSVESFADIISDMILLQFGYRFVWFILQSETSEERDFQIRSLQKVYENFYTK